jgi:predicted nucleic acid-binding protein
LLALEQQYGLRLIQDVSDAEIHVVAGRLQSAFLGDTLRRTIHEGDARIAASAFLKGERLVTSDLRFFKRAKDLGLDVESWEEAGQRFWPHPINLAV